MMRQSNTHTGRANCTAQLLQEEKRAEHAEKRAEKREERRERHERCTPVDDDINVGSSPIASRGRHKFQQAVKKAAVRHIQLLLEQTPFCGLKT